MLKNIHVYMLGMAALLMISPLAAFSNDDLVIPLDQITGNASFISAEVDGKNIEVIAVRDSNGEVRTAFNTCQVCFASPQVYYKQSGNTLVCQNCGNHFSMDHVGVRAGGCNPWPIHDENRTITDDAVVIPHEYLEKTAEEFSQWRTEY